MGGAEGKMEMEVAKVEMERGRKVLTAHDRIRINGEW